MARDRDDAWKLIAPLDRLADVANDTPETEAVNPRASVRFSVYLKGTQAIFVAEGNDDTVEVKFRYRRQMGAWQMFRRHGSRWIADGPASEKAGRLLEQLVLVMQGADPARIFT